MWYTLVAQYRVANLHSVMEVLQKTANQDDDDGSTLKTKLLALLHSNRNKGAPLAVMEFFLSTTAASTTNTAKHETLHHYNAKNGQRRTTASKGTTIPAIHVDALMQARERALANELFWGVVDDKQTSALPLWRHKKVRTHRSRLHREKSDEQLRQEAQQLAEFLQRSLPRRMYNSVMNLFQDYAGLRDTSSKPSLLGSYGTKSDSAADRSGTKKLVAISRLSGYLYRQVSSHLSLIAVPLAAFFYMGEGLDVNPVEKDRHVLDSQRRLDASRLSFVEGMMEVQIKLMACLAVDESIRKDESSRDDGVSEEELAASESELITWTPKPTPRRDRRYRAPSHIRLEAMVLQQGRQQETVTDTSRASQMVFIDNLPVDISEDEVKELYSRCGDIERVVIFNRRPDLDPGPLSREKVQERRKQQLRALRGSKWYRPRTPVYALVTFADDKGRQRALDYSLRIFGMVIRRHPARSISSEKMTRLYLENIPTGAACSACSELENHLSQYLQPELFACMDAGQNNRVVVGSCEIKFPSFELALKSYERLSERFLQSEGAYSINWLRTPKDADKWWTRSIGFD